MFFLRTYLIVFDANIKGMRIARFFLSCLLSLNKKLHLRFGVSLDWTHLLGRALSCKTIRKGPPYSSSSLLSSTSSSSSSSSLSSNIGLALSCKTIRKGSTIHPPHLLLPLHCKHLRQEKRKAQTQSEWNFKTENKRQNLIKWISSQVVQRIPFCICFPCSLHRHCRLLCQVFKTSSSSPPKNYFHPHFRCLLPKAMCISRSEIPRGKKNRGCQKVQKWETWKLKHRHKPSLLFTSLTIFTFHVHFHFFIFLPFRSLPILLSDIFSFGKSEIRLSWEIVMVSFDKYLLEQSYCQKIEATCSSFWFSSLLIFPK